MNEDLTVLNNNNKNEKLKTFFINNRGKLISGFIIFIFIAIGVYSYENYITSKKKEISDNFNAIIIDYSDSTKEKTINSLIGIINEKDPTYSPLSLYFIIDNNLVKERATINSFFEILINDTSLEDEIKNLIIYKKALFNADYAQESELLKMLNPLINSKSVWKSHALYLMAEYFFSNNQKQKAKEFFNQIVSLENSNPDLKLQSEKRLNRDLSE
tara:strand:+ start:196 stop:840 length:645 start_codon:yes stop_codon:yes gene_type:complete